MGPHGLSIWGMKSLRRTMEHGVFVADRWSAESFSLTVQLRRVGVICASAGCSDSFHGQRGVPRHSFFVSYFVSIVNRRRGQLGPEFPGRVDERHDVFSMSPGFVSFPWRTCRWGEEGLGVFGASRSTVVQSVPGLESMIPFAARLRVRAKRSRAQQIRRNRLRDGRNGREQEARASGLSR